MPAYPEGHAARDRFIANLRPARPPGHDPFRAHAVVVEDERTEAGAVARVATVFLTGRECPWRCVMCDLWQHTTTTDTPQGAITTQVTAAVRDLAVSHPDVTRIKLYNAGSFFDPRAVPPGDYDGVAEAVRGYDRVVVESHPALVGARTVTLIDALRRHGGGSQVSPVLEVAMGLETAHPGALERINKRMTIADVRHAADRIAVMGAALRVFLLVTPPFVADADQDDWLVRSVDAALECGASAVSLIPSRHGNGAMDALMAAGHFRPPHLADLERGFALAIARPRQDGARVFADVWDLDRFATCPHCLPARRQRLLTMNLEQRVAPRVSCIFCDGGPVR